LIIGKTISRYSVLEKLGEGGACPHGNAVLPVSPVERKRKGEIQLSQAAEGKRYAVISLQERDPKLLEFLHAAGIGPGKILKVVRQNYDQTVLIDLATGNSILGRPAAEAVWLKAEKQGTEPRESRGPEEQIKRR